MKKKIYVALVVLSFAVLSAGCSFFGKKDGAVPEEVVQSSADVVQEENVQISVDETHLDLLEKMMIVKDEEVFNSEFLAAPCTLYQAYELLNTMKGQDGAAVSFSYHGQQITQKDLLTLYLKELFGIEVTEAEGSSFEFYANELELTEAFCDQEAVAINNDLLSLAHACVLYGLDDWKNTKTVFQQMLESGFFNDTDITTFENAAMDDIFNYGTLKCPAMEIYDEDTARTYHFLTYFGNSYNSSTKKNFVAVGSHNTGCKEILIRPYYSMQNNTADGTGFVFTRFPGGMSYWYDIETQTTKYIDTVSCTVVGSNYMYLSKSDTLYYIKEVDGVNWVYRKAIRSDEEPEPIVKIVTGNLIHVSDDEKYLSIVSSDSSYKDGSGRTGFVRIDIENKKVEVVAHHSITTNKMPGTNSVGHVTVNPVYPELFFFANIVDGYLSNVQNRANILNAETGEVITINPGTNTDTLTNKLPTTNIQFTHESWSENGEYLYITNIGSTRVGDNLPERGMIRVNKDGTHMKYIYSPTLSTGYWQWGYSYPFLTNHASASGDDRYVAASGYHIIIISQETNQVFPIAQIIDLRLTKDIPAVSKHPYHAHPTVSRGDTYLVNWGHYYIPDETRDDFSSGLLGVGYYDFSEIDEKELAEGGEFAYNEYVSRLSYESPDNLHYVEQLSYANLDCESTEGTFFEKEAIRAKAGNYVYFNINTSIVDSINDTVTITFDYYDNGAKDMKLIYTKAIENEYDYGYMENGSADIACTNSGEWKRAEVVVHGNFETSGTYGSDFKIGSASTDVYVTNIEVKKN